MKNTLLILFLSLLAASVLTISPAELAAAPGTSGEYDAPDTTRRFALTVGANDGGKDLVRLRYANTDAEAVGQVLVEMGGVQSEDHVLLADPRASELKQSIDQMRANIASEQARGRRTELVFYYSGHSNEHGLLLGTDHVPYKELRGWLADVPADVQVVILDSCAAGAATRTKGGQRMPAFLSDQSGQAQGMAILTSSSDTEASQESDAIGASFFTYYLIAGLRGAADSSGDRRVTLNEAYRHAFDETLARTQRAFSGAQHPAYDIQMTGQSDLVLTELQQTNAVLQIDRHMQGRLFFRSQPDGRLVAEMTKYPGRPLELGLPSATYEVTLEHNDKVYQATANMRQGRTTQLTFMDFEQVSQEPTRRRGSSVADATTDAEAPPAVYFGADLLPYVGMSSGNPEMRRTLSLNIIGGISHGSDVLEIGGALNIATGYTSGVQIGGAANFVGGDVNGVQIGGSANIVGGSTRGVQIGGAANVTRESMRGLQIGGAVNITAGAVNGIQIAGATNITRESMRGLQLAGAVNATAGPVNGVQIAGALNIADDVRGVQIAPVNIAAGDVHGLQLGVVNIARSADVGIGLLSIYADGFTNMEVFAADDGLAMIGLRHGSKSIYNTYSVGSRIMKSGNPGLAFSLGLGWRTRLSRNLEFSIDGTVTQVVDFDYGWSKTHALHKVRPMLTWNITDNFALFGGPTATLQFVGRGGEIFAPARHWELTDKDDVVHLAIWPGFTLGARFF